MNLIELLFEEMSKDDEDWDKASEGLKNYYYRSDDAVKGVINDCFIYICGWSLSTLMERHDKITGGTYE